jgi:hypothetical protein
MSTRLQKKLAEEIVLDAKLKRTRQKKDLLVSAGYSEITASANPAIILEAQGVKNELNNLGFSEEGAKQVVAEILYDKNVVASSRLSAADQVFKVQGSYAPDKHINVNMEVEAPPEIKELTSKLNDLYRGTGESSDGRESGTVGDQAQDKE